MLYTHTKRRYLAANQSALKRFKFVKKLFTFAELALVCAAIVVLVRMDAVTAYAGVGRAVEDGVGVSHLLDWFSQVAGV